MQFSTLICLALATAVSVQANNCNYGPDTCVQGFVWREAYSGDVVCVDAATRSQAAADNAAAPGRWVSGAYGPQTCVQGYVWREARQGDHVCVPPATRTQTGSDNAQAAYRAVCNCGEEWETTSEQWFGTAPFCNGQCPDGWTQIRSSSTASRCDPSQKGHCVNCAGTSSHSCWTGSKVLCRLDVASISQS